MTDSTSPLVRRAALAGLAGQQFCGSRDLYEVLGYDRVLTPQDYHDAYERGDVAGRIVDAYPDATWGECPDVVKPHDDATEATEIEGFNELAKRFQFWRVLHRLDRLTSLGHYGVLVLGLDGGEPMYTPAQRKDYGLLYMQPHSERTAQILEWEDDPTSARYGQPRMYGIEAGTNWTGRGAGRMRAKVHHSRVIHVAERAMEDPSIGTPRLQRVWNRLDDLNKLLGGGAEIYWKNAAMLLQLNADASTEFQPGEAEALRGQIDEMMHGLNRFLRTQGVTAQNLAPGMSGADPSAIIDKEIDFIAGATGIPQRILMGSEAGELASSQDSDNWSNRVMERRQQHAGPSILAPVIDRLMALGCLKAQDYEIEWPDDDQLGEEARANIAKAKVETLSSYNGVPGNELIVSPTELRELIGLEGAPPAMADEPPLDEADAEVSEQFAAMKRVK